MRRSSRRSSPPSRLAVLDVWQPTRDVAHSMSGPAYRDATLAAAALALASAGCFKTQYTPPPCNRPDMTGCIVEGVTLTGNDAVKGDDVTDKIATAESGHTLNGALEQVPILSILDRLSVDYERLDPFVLERDLARVERVYRARGFYEAHARAARVTKDGRGRVHVQIVVQEGLPVLVKEVKLEWKDKDKHKPPETHDWQGAQKRMDGDAQRAIEAVVKGDPLDEAKFEGVKGQLKKAMTTHGFAYAKVDAKADVDLVKHTAVVTYTAETGPPTIFGKISLDPAGMPEEERLRHIMSLDEGAIYSTGKLDRAQGALSELRFFGSVDYAPPREPIGQADADGVVAVPVTFRFTPTLRKTVRMGFGLDAGTRVDVHGLAGWENHDFLGGLRTFTIEARPGIVFFPYTLSSLVSGAPESNFAIVPELHVHTALGQPGFVEARTRGTISADFNVFQLQPTATLGYLEGSIKAGIERAFYDGKVKVNVFANGQVDQPLKLQLPGLALEPCAGGYNFLVLPYAQATGSVDLRRGYDGKPDAVNTHSGFYLSNDVQVAAGPAANSSTDIKIRPDIRGYIPIAKKMTLALRFGGGVLYPFGGDLTKDPYPSAVIYSPRLAPLDLTQPNQCKILSSFVPKGDVLRGSYIQLLQLRGFQSGGPNSNRGYAYSGIGPQEQVQGISPLSATNTLVPIATGGKALWEASIELRFPEIKGQIGTTLFLDASDIRDTLGDFATNFAPHLSTGLGVRYGTPVGALRLDVALRIPGAQVIGSGTACQTFDPTASPSAAQIWKPGKPSTSGPCYLDPQFGQAGSLGVAPILISLGIGEAF